MTPTLRPHSGPPGRAGGAVLTTLLLLLAVAVVILGYWRIKAHRKQEAIVLSAPLLPVPADQITGLLVTRKDGQFRLDRTDGGAWTLSVGTSDYVDPRSVDFLLHDLTSAVGGPVLPGTEPEDRRYDFNGEQALRLTIFLENGRRLSLALGTINPVTGRYYASGLGRAGCFMVEAALQRRLVQLPRSVELKTLLPEVKAADLSRIDLWRGKIDHRLVRHEGRWWLQVPPGGPARLGRDVVDYAAYYRDRMRSDQDGDWVLASTAAVGMLVYEMSQVAVREIKPAAEAAAWYDKWELDEPWRKVVLTGEGINPDPTAPAGDVFTLLFAAPLGSQLIPVARREVVLLADGQAAKTLDRPLEELVHRSALTFKVMPAVKLSIEREGRVVLAGERDPGPVEGEGRLQWRTTVPVEGSSLLPAKQRRNLAGETVVEMDRMPLLKPLPPVTDSSPLLAKEQIEVRVTFAPGAAVPEMVFRMGYLRPDVFPELVQPVPGGRPVGLWRPDSGQLLQVSDGLVVTARNLAVSAP